MYLKIKFSINFHLHHHSTVTDCFGNGVVPKKRSNVVVDFDLLEIIQELKSRYQK